MNIKDYSNLGGNPVFDETNPVFDVLPSDIEKFLNSPPGAAVQGGNYRAARLLKACHAYGVTCMSLDGMSEIVVTSGPGRLAADGGSTYNDMLTTIRTQLGSSATKSVERELKAAATDLTPAVTGTIFGIRYSISVPADVAFTGLAFSCAFGGASTLAGEILLRRNVNMRQACVLSGVLLAVGDSGGRGIPGVASGATLTIAHGQPGLVDGSTVIELESLNGRDLSK
jgi:hypothetical protein